VFYVTFRHGGQSESGTGETGTFRDAKRALFRKIIKNIKMKTFVGLKL